MDPHRSQDDFLRLEDMATLRDIMSTARNPPGLLSVKLTEMEQGRFVARGAGDGVFLDLVWWVVWWVVLKILFVGSKAFWWCFFVPDL